MSGRQRERLTEAEYEEHYAEALRVLFYNYDTVDLPYRNEKGERICRVESLDADDKTVFLLAFGSDIANDLVRGNPVHIRLRHATAAG